MAIGISNSTSLCLMLLIVGAASFQARGQHTSDSMPVIESSIRARHYEEALQMTTVGLKRSPDDFRLWALKGIILAIKNEKQEALRAFDRALRLSPNYPVALKGEVQLYYDSLDQRAVPLLKRILDADPKDETAHEMLGVLDERSGNCKAANEEFRRSANVMAGHPGTLEAYGDCLMQTSRYQAAVSEFEQLSSLIPERTYPKYDLAVALMEAKEHAAAVKVLAPLLTADHPDPDLLSLASDAYEAIGDTPKAVSLLRQAIVLDPGNADYYTSFAALCLTHESFQVGIDMISAGLTRIPTDSALYIARGLLYAQLADYDRAEADFKTAEDLDSKQSLTAYALDLAELQKNSHGNTPAQIRAQLRRHPDSALLQYLLAKVLSEQGAGSDTKVSEEAFTSVKTALKLKPDLVEARDLLATMYMRMGQYPPAIRECRQALLSNPEDQTAIYHLIVALRHSGHNDEHEEIEILVRRLAELQKVSRQQETDRKRFRLIEQAPEPKP